MTTHLRHVSLMILLGLLVACGQKPEPLVPPAARTSDSQAPASDGTTISSRLEVINFSPERTRAGEAFNVQADGNSGISFELDRAAPPADFAVWFDGKPLTGVVAAGKIVTATIPAEYMAEPGRYPIALDVGGTRIPAGEFVVDAP